MERAIFVCLFPVTCPNTKVRVGRSAFFGFVFVLLLLKGILHNKWLNKCENSVFRVIFVKKKKRFARVGTFSRDGRVTGNKHILFYALSMFLINRMINIAKIPRKTQKSAIFFQPPLFF